jgi:hypothetical protein
MDDKVWANEKEKLVKDALKKYNTERKEDIIEKVPELTNLVEKILKILTENQILVEENKLYKEKLNKIKSMI